MDKFRLDKWLWAARFYKTRSLACEEIDKGRVQVNGALAKASREVRVGDTIALRQGSMPRTVVVRGLSQVRGPAPVAQALYEETAESLEQRERLAQQRRLAPEPADALLQGRPTKRDRRQIDALDTQHAAASRGAWNDRWSASFDER
ncbi:MAG: RNA-binding S4 domain-containing protein [Betaproteobacteria bacterium]|nr:RNA-binding S4 domain-containing protein [Betaproteobacteria bacterium]